MHASPVWVFSSFVVVWSLCPASSSFTVRCVLVLHQAISTSCPTSPMEWTIPRLGTHCARPTLFIPHNMVAHCQGQVCVFRKACILLGAMLSRRSHDHTQFMSANCRLYLRLPASTSVARTRSRRITGLRMNGLRMYLMKFVW